MKFKLIALIPLMISGCDIHQYDGVRRWSEFGTTKTELSQIDEQKCLSRGLTPGSDSLKKCVIYENNIRIRQLCHAPQCYITVEQQPSKTK